jgi:hypothetical protein
MSKKDKNPVGSKDNRGGTARLKCSCPNTFQDKMYGAGVRVHNGTKDGHRCTSCGKKH